MTGWSMDNVLMCRDRQRDILRDVWPALKCGGLLIYSTCTLNHYEDEENVAWIAEELGAEVISSEVPADWGISGNLLLSSPVPSEVPGASDVPVCHFIQGMTRGEGFFMARVAQDRFRQSHMSVRKRHVGKVWERKAEKGCHA